MSEILVKHSSRGRLYVRRFDHWEVAQRVAAGERVKELAAEYGVTPNAIYQAVRRLDPAVKEADNVYRKEWRTTVCETCGGPAMKNIGTKALHNPDGRVLCNTCRGRAMRTRFRFDDAGRLVSVQCQRTQCANGERWQPPASFAGHPRFRDLRPNGMNTLCRKCNTKMKREWRHRTGRD